MEHERAFMNWEEHVSVPLGRRFAGLLIPINWSILHI